MLRVRNTGDESLGYDLIMVRIAACEAGVRRLDYDLDVPSVDSISSLAGKARGSERLSPPCVAGVQEADSAANGAED